MVEVVASSLVVEELVHHNNLVVLHIVLDRHIEEVVHMELEVERKLEQVLVELYHTNVNKVVDRLGVEVLELLVLPGLQVALLAPLDQDIQLVHTDQGGQGDQEDPAGQGGLLVQVHLVDQEEEEEEQHSMRAYKLEHT